MININTREKKKIQKAENHENVEEGFWPLPQVIPGKYSTLSITNMKSNTLYCLFHNYRNSHVCLCLCPFQWCEFLLDHGRVKVRILVMAKNGVLICPGINQSFHFVEDWNAWPNPVNNYQQNNQSIGDYQSFPLGQSFINQSRSSSFLWTKTT